MLTPKVSLEDPQRAPMMLRRDGGPSLRERERSEVRLAPPDQRMVALQAVIGRATGGSRIASGWLASMMSRRCLGTIW